MVDQGIKRVDAVSKTEYWAYGGDYGDHPNDKNFCINGLFFPDRTPHPAVAEFKRLQQPVHLSILDRTGALTVGAAALTLEVENRYTFLALDHLHFKYEIVSDASPDALASGTCEIMEEDATLVVRGLKEDALLAAVAATIATRRPSPRLFLNVASSLRDDAPWASRGHVVSQHQFPLTLPSLGAVVARRAFMDSIAGGPVRRPEIVRRAGRVAVAIGGREVLGVDAATGSLTSYRPDADEA